MVALPSFHLIARAFPNSERALLTSFSPHERTVSPLALLDETGLIHQNITYVPERWNLPGLLRLREEIKHWEPDILIYLAEPRGRLSPWRDALFFKGCGIRRIIGVPYTKAMRENRWLAERGSFEHESERLARCLKELGEAWIDQSSSWDLRLTGAENERARRTLEGWDGKKDFIVCHVTAKVREKDWGNKNWSSLFTRLSQSYPDLGAILIGGADEAEESAGIAKAWEGKTLNLCGRLSPRESAAVMKKALLYLGHDSGPMHLAAAMGVSCVALFVVPPLPGVWFPYGATHRVICPSPLGRSVAPITVDQVFRAVSGIAESRRTGQ